MNASNHRLVVTQGARKNLQHIGRYTRQHWGPDQRERYLRNLEQAMERIRGFPDLGRVRDEVGVGVRSYVCADHVIYYRVDADTVIVLRILHVRMDTPTDLPG